MSEDRREPNVFSYEEIKAIRHMLDTGDTIPLCPRCKSKMRQEGPLAGGGSVGLVWRMSCDKCNLAGMVAESMARLRPNPDGS
jgi:hypothetical protein